MQICQISIFLSIFHTVLSFLCTELWTASPHTPRVVILGPTGSGKSLQASNLARKYNLVEVDMDMLIKQRIASGSRVGSVLKPFMEREMMSKLINEAIIAISYPFLH